MPTITDLSINLETENELNIGLKSEKTFGIGLIDRGNGSSTVDYNKLKNHPEINGVELVNNKSFEDLGIGIVSSEDITTIVDDAFNQIFG